MSIGFFLFSEHQVQKQTNKQTKAWIQGLGRMGWEWGDGEFQHQLQFWKLECYCSYCSRVPIYSEFSAVKQPFIMLTDCVGGKFGQGTAGQLFLSWKS